MTVDALWLRACEGEPSALATGRDLLFAIASGLTTIGAAPLGDLSANDALLQAELLARLAALRGTPADRAKLYEILTARRNSQFDAMDRLAHDLIYWRRLNDSERHAASQADLDGAGRRMVAYTEELAALATEIADEGDRDAVASVAGLLGRDVLRGSDLAEEALKDLLAKLDPALAASISAANLTHPGIGDPTPDEKEATK